MNSKNKVYSYLKNQIISGKLLPNEPIAEMNIASILNVSRTPVREAIRELERDGLIVNYPARGSFVTDITLYDIDEIYELKSLLMNWALERSIKNISAKSLEQMKRKLEKDYANDTSSVRQCEKEVYKLICEKSYSKRLILILNNMELQIERISSFGEMFEEDYKSIYENIIELIQYLQKDDLESSKNVLKKCMDLEYTVLLRKGKSLGIVY